LTVICLITMCPVHIILSILSDMNLSQQGQLEIATKKGNIRVTGKAFI